MDPIILTGIISVASSSITAFVTFLLTKKKYKTEVDANQIENMQKSLNFYISITEQNKKELKILLDSNDELMLNNRTLIAQNNELLIQNKTLLDEVEELKKTVVDLTLQLSEYKNSNQSLVLVGAK